MIEMLIGGRPCLVHGSDRPEVALVQLTARHEDKSRPDMLALLDDTMPCRYVLVAVPLARWAASLMPWPDEAVSRDGEVGRHAADTLSYIEQELLPWLQGRHGTLPCILGGYSLGGLFALWASCCSGRFAGIAAVSPSVWIKGWGSFARCHATRASVVYLSLGDREEHARNRRMAAVGDCIREQHALLAARLGAGRTVLQWNCGGHFDDEARRMARGFVWVAAKM